MNAVAIGPLVFAPDRLAVLIAAFVFLIAAGILARRVDRSLSGWSTWALVGGFIGARLGHVAVNWQTFRIEPWRAVAFWQGGFEPAAGFVGVAIVSALCLRSIKGATAAAAALGLAGIVWLGAWQLTQATLGQPAPTAPLEQIDGPPMAIADLGGRPAVVNLWASWCPPCRREMPLLAEVAASRDDVGFLFVNQGEAAEKVRAYLAREKISLRHVLLDRAMQTSRHYHALGMPVTLFLRADGTLASLHLGEISRETLNAKIEKIANPG